MVLEDRTKDAEILIQELRLAGFEPDWERAKNEAEFIANLDSDLDIILADYSLPQFTALDALAKLQERRLDIPFIIVSGTLGDERAAQCIREGVTDYLLKDRLGRLGQAVSHALEEKRSREERGRGEQLIGMLATALKTIADGIIITDLTGAILWVNPAFTVMTGYEPKEVLGQTPRVLKSGRHGKDFYQQMWATILKGQVWRGHFINRRKDGSLYDDEHTIAPIVSGDGKISHFVGIMRDVTEKRKAEDELRTTHEQLRHLLAHSPAVLYSLRLDGERLIPTVGSDNVSTLLGFTVEETLVERWWWDQVHPEDLDRATEAITLALSTGQSTVQYRVRHRDGAYIWVEDKKQRVCDSSGRPTNIVGIWTDITERKQLEGELRFREERLNSFFRSATVGLALFDADLRYTHVNQTMAEIKGLSVEEHIGKTFREMVPRLGATVEPMLTGVLATGHPVLNAEISGETASDPGMLRHWMVSYFPILGSSGKPQGVGAIVAETTEIKRLETERARLAESRLLLLNSTDQGIYGVDTERKCSFINKAGAAMLGYEPEELVGQVVHELIHHHRPDGAVYAIDDCPVCKVIRDGIGSRTDHESFWNKNGDSFPVEYSSHPVIEGGKHKGAVVVFTNITEKKQVESQLLRAQRLESLGTLAGGIAHDLNNVLAPILMSIDVLRINPGGEEEKRMLAIIETSAQRGAGMVKQVLTFARGVSGERVLVQVNHLIKEIAKVLRQTFPKNIQVRTATPYDLWPVLSDSTQLHQVLMNLSINARDAMPGGGTLMIGASNVSLDGTFVATHLEARVGPHVVLVVKDTGTGMPPAVQERIFEPFFTTKSLDKGTGLGLATVLGIVRSHGGFINVVSDLGHGSEFNIYLPADPSRASTEPNDEDKPLRKGNGETILIVDDESAILEIAKEALETLGYKVLTAHDGAEAIAVAAKQQRKINVLLTDMMMPLVDGLATIRAIRRMDPRIRIIATSGLGFDLKESEAQELGVQAFLHKPYTTRMLGETLAEVLSQADHSHSL